MGSDWSTVHQGVADAEQGDEQHWRPYFQGGGGGGGGGFCLPPPPKMNAYIHVLLRVGRGRSCAQTSTPTG